MALTKERKDLLVFVSTMQDELAVSNGFEENIDYKLSTFIGDGAFGTCNLAVTPVPDPAGDTNEGTVFCVKEVRFLPE